MTCGRSGARSRGLTLIELMVTLAIVVILTALGVPAFGQLLKTRAVSSHVETFGSAVRLARSESLKRGIPIRLCVTADPDAASPACAGTLPAQGWASGWLMLDSNGQVLRVQQSLSSSGGVDTAALTIQFSPNGLTTLSTDATFTFKPLGGSTSMNKSVCVSAQGRLRPGACA